MFPAWALSSAILVASASAPPLVGDATLVVSFPGLRPQGQVTVAVFSTDKAWRGRRDAVRTAVRTVAGSTVEVRFEGLAPGAYGVMAYHDRNANGRLDTLPIGLPTEPYGFSRNARGTFGPPDWSAAAVTLRTGETTSEQIRLR